MKNILKPSLGLFVIALLALPGRADTVTNNSFEAPSTLPASYSIVASGSGSGTIPGWTFADSSSGGSVGGLSQAGPVSGVTDVQYSFFNINGASDGSGGYATITYGDGTSGLGLDYTPLPTIAADTDYTLTVALAGQLVSVFDSGNYQLNLLAGTDIFTTSVAQSDITANTFGDYSVTLDAATIAADGLVGKSLGIQLVAEADTADGTFNQDGFDNVRLTEVAVPEPSTFALIGLAGGFGMFFLRSRMRYNRIA